MDAVNYTSVVEGEMGTISCEMYGYLRGEIEWLKNGQQVQSGGRYSITVRTGSREGQDGGEDSVSSVVSQLTIQQVKERDEGTYTCRVADLQDTVYLNVTMAPVNSPIAAVAAGVAVVVVLLMVVIGIVILLIVYFCCKNNKTPAVGTVSHDRTHKSTATLETSLQEYRTATDIDYTYSVVDEKPQSQNFADGHDKKVIETSLCLEWNKNAVPKLVKVTSTKGLLMEPNPLYESAEHATTIAISEPVYSYVPEEVEGQSVPIYSIPNQPVGITQSDSYVEDSLLSPIYAAPDLTKKYRPPLEISEDNIREIHEIGFGQFGEVMLAETIGLSLKDLRYSTDDDDKTCSVQVAVKRIRCDAESTAKDAFKKEMRFMSQLNHDNVVRLLAINDSASPFMVMEYMKYGDLNQFLKEADFSETHPPLLPTDVSSAILVSMTVQIADGMAYLASHNFIHRDLATRNVLVGDNCSVKLSDFGLSKNLYESAYYHVKGRAKMPVRWMSWECFYGKFSEKSDVWAYGVTIWEIFALAREPPFANLTDQEVVDDALKAADRTILDKPTLCPDKLYELLCNMCWASEGSERATFQELYSTLDELTRDGFMI